jgi:hypothetical protein
MKNLAGAERRRTYRGAFTVLEVTVAMGVLVFGMVLAVRVAVWCLMERERSDSRHQAIETAANVLERARALDWKDLNESWAKAQKLPETVRMRLPDSSLAVAVVPATGQPRTKRVTVDLHWRLKDGTPAEGVHLVTLFSERTAAASGEKP